VEGKICVKDPKGGKRFKKLRLKKSGGGTREKDAASGRELVQKKTTKDRWSDFFEGRSWPPAGSKERKREVSPNSEKLTDLAWRRLERIFKRK